MRGFSTEVRQCSKYSLKSSLSSFFPVFVTVEGILAVCEEVRAIRVSRIECAAERDKILVFLLLFVFFLMLSVIERVKS